MQKYLETGEYFKSHDGTELFFRSWKPKNPSNKAVILIHRGHEHSGRLRDLAVGLGLDDQWAFGYDSRGHGQSPGPRGYAESFDSLVKDLDHFVRMISEKHDIPFENISVVANSVGAVVASTWVHDYAPRIRCMVLAAPAFRIKLYVPGAIPGLRLLNQIKKPAFISSYVKSKMLTHDVEESRRYDLDPMITRDIAVNILLGLHDTSTRIMSDAGAIQVPTLVLSAGSDWVVKLSAQKRFFENLGSKTKKMHVFPKFYHGVLYEKGREEAFKMARDFILEDHPQMTTEELVESDARGFTKSEYDQISNSVNIFMKLNYMVTKLMMGTLGRLSDGVNVGFKSGFDSGVSLDHIYKNKASGRLLIGKIIDYFYINAIGWRGIRKRSENMQETLSNVVESLSAAGESVRIVDVASGPGRYLIDFVNKNRDRDITAELRDYSVEGLKEASRHAEELGLDNVTVRSNNAFEDKTSYDSSERPNVVIVSGLLELFPDNQLALKCIKSAFDTLADGGYVIYTGQPWHPQLEFIAQVLPNHRGQSWIMRRRTQLELDALFASVGFEKEKTNVGPFGIFNVSVARKQKEVTARVSKSATPEMTV